MPSERYQIIQHLFDKASKEEIDLNAADAVLANMYPNDRDEFLDAQRRLFDVVWARRCFERDEP